MLHYDIPQCMVRKPAFTFSPTDLRLLRIFQAVVRHEGFAAAQDELGLSPGTISNHISHLEARFAVRLCERGRKGFSLTPDGVRILEAAENLLRSVENFTGIVGSVRGELTGTVHLGTVDAMHTNGAAPLHHAIARFNDLAPKVLLHVEIASPQDLLQRLLDGRYGVILTPIEEVHPSITARPFFQEEQRLYCGRNHPLFDVANAVSAAAVRQYPYVGRTYIKGEARAREEAFNHRAMTSHMEAIAILVKSGRFLGYLPDHFARSFVETGEMASLLDAELAYFDTFHMALRKDERNRATLLLSQCLSTILDRSAQFR
jgi:LysR family transcriptional regulator, transcriptional activator for bauABCD operon